MLEYNLDKKGENVLIFFIYKIINYVYKMFFYCSSLNSLDLSSFKTTNVINMSEMFGGISEDCSSLISLNISSFNTCNITNMDFMFCNCSSLNFLNLSHLVKLSL